MDKLMGLGAYSHSRIRRNALLRPDPPMIANSFRGDENSTVIRHREFIQNITSSATAGTFEIQTFPINPAQPTTFPWLSTVAQNFEEYVLEGLCFEFQSTSSDAIASSTNLALGSVMMVTQYDVENPAFTNAQSLLNYDWSQSCKVSETALHFVECDPRQNVMQKLFTRNPAESTTDLRFTDLGNFSIATEGLQGTSVMIGRLWVSYQIRLSKPKVGAGSVAGGSFFSARNYGGTVTWIAPFGTISEITNIPENSLPVTLSQSGQLGQIQFPVQATPATYLVQYSIKCDAVTSGTGLAFSAFTNCAQLLMYNDLTANEMEFPTSSSSTVGLYISTYVDVPAGAAPAYCRVGVGPNVVNAEMDILVVSVPYLDPNIYG